MGYIHFEPFPCNVKLALYVSATALKFCRYNFQACQYYGIYHMVDFFPVKYTNNS